MCTYPTNSQECQLLHAVANNMAMAIQRERERAQSILMTRYNAGNTW